MNFGFIIDNRKCIGCHACTVACKSEHDVPIGVNQPKGRSCQERPFGCVEAISEASLANRRAPFAQRQAGRPHDVARLLFLHQHHGPQVGWLPARSQP